MLTVLGGLAEFERALIAARTGEGRKHAQERGVRFGRPRKLTPHQRQEALQRWLQVRRKRTSPDCSMSSPPTISRLAAGKPFRARRGRPVKRGRASVIMTPGGSRGGIASWCHP